MNILSPSLLSADFNRLGEAIDIIDSAGAEYIHIDVMDGMFVPSISYGMPVIKSIRKSTGKVFDVHLMINEPIRYISDFVDSGADIITVHVEACADVVATLEKIKSCGVKAGITLNPDTPVSAIEAYMPMVDMVLVMSVNPGFGGQKFITSSIDKLKEVRRLRQEKNLDFDIEIDGGINLDNLASVLEAGANVIVAGSAIYSGDAAENVKKFKSVMSVW
jgi:ribulose-phosphate 3-epimerase